MTKLRHEEIFRGKVLMEKISAIAILICGAGALGSQLSVNLARSGFRKLTVIDRDRVEEHNIGTQIYGLDDIGAKKSEILRNMIYRELGEEIRSLDHELHPGNINKVIKGAELVIDVFDNTKSRSLVADYCKENHIDCLHAGMNEGFAEIRWNESYRVPQEIGLDLCDYPLARNLILLTVAVASESVVKFVLNSEKLNYSITLGDLHINHEID